MIRIGVIGAGHLGKIHLKLLKELREFEVVGFFDIDKQTARDVEERSAVKHFDSLPELLALCDAIDIVCPTPFHYEYATQAIKAGRHVFIEKPVTQNAAEAKKLLVLANEAGIVAHAGHVERFNPAFIASKPHIKRPIFIDCRRIAVYNPRGTDVSVVLDLMVHDIDLVLNLVRSPVKKISATGSPVVCPTDDIAEARIEFDNGCVANLSASRVANHNERKINIFQDENYFSLDLLDKKAFKAYPSAPHPGVKFLNNEPLPVEPINAIGHELQLFARAIQKEKTEAVTLEDACNTMRVADEIMETIRKNK